jgi:hypothetical protein
MPVAPAPAYSAGVPPTASHRSVSVPALTARSTIVAGLAALLCAGALAVAATLAHARWHADPDRAVMFIFVGSGLFIAAALLAALVVRRSELTPARVAHVAVLATAMVCCGFSLYRLGAYIAFPADILVWSESDFVNDIIKLRVGHPLYTAQVNNESFVYPPGAQLLTYVVASLVGHGSSIPALRAVQLAYTIVAALLATLAVRRLLQLAGVHLRRPLLWAALWMPLMLLVATNTRTNDYIVYLHNDALAQLISTAAFWACVEYGATRRRWLLALMMLLPAAGFLVKQSLVLWLALATLFLLVADRPFSWRRVSLVAVGGALLVLAALLGGLAVWGEPFRYWTLSVLGAHGVSPLRSLQHAVSAWAFFGGGVLAALVLVRGPRRHVLLGAWTAWLLLLATETYTSGIAWMLNHLGPGTLIAGSWIAAALTALASEQGTRLEERSVEGWLRGAGAAALGVLALGGLDAVRMPTRPFGPDAARYVGAIERELAADPATTLLDVGSWVYVRHGIVMKDRAPSIGERGFSLTGDFSGIRQRIAERRYSKILVRGYEADDSWYDEPYWPQRSGVRAAMQANYVQIGVIPAMQLEENGAGMRYLFREISVLVPRSP